MLFDFQMYNYFGHVEIRVCSLIWYSDNTRKPVVSSPCSSPRHITRKPYVLHCLRSVTAEENGFKSFQLILCLMTVLPLFVSRVVWFLTTIGLAAIMWHSGGMGSHGGGWMKLMGMVHRDRRSAQRHVQDAATALLAPIDRYAITVQRKMNGYHDRFSPSPCIYPSLPISSYL